MAGKRHKPEEIVLKLRQVDVLPLIGPPGWRFSWVGTHGGDAGCEPFIIDIGVLFPIALWELTLL